MPCAKRQNLQPGPYPPFSNLEQVVNKCLLTIKSKYNGRRYLEFDQVDGERQGKGRAIYCSKIQKAMIDLRRKCICINVTGKSL